jgi:hypothetical protein
MINTKNFKKYFPEFLDLYKTRPIKDNAGGMRWSQSFNFYCALKELQPTLVVESGIWKGHSTWIIKNAVPNADIMSFDIDLSLIEYKFDGVQYLEQDINTVDWNEFFKDYPEKTSEKTVLFLDDHQNFSERLDFFEEAPFMHIIFEDNYPKDQGDIDSPKKIIEVDVGEKYKIDKPYNRYYVEMTQELKDKFYKRLDTYIELPPLYILENTRWGTSWSYYSTPDPIFKNDEILDEDCYQNCKDYTWMCYLKLKL